MCICLKPRLIRQEPPRMHGSARAGHISTTNRSNSTRLVNICINVSTCYSNTSGLWHNRQIFTGIIWSHVLLSATFPTLRLIAPFQTKNANGSEAKSSRREKGATSDLSRQEDSAGSTTNRAGLLPATLGQRSAFMKQCDLRNIISTNVSRTTRLSDGLSAATQMAETFRLRSRMTVAKENVWYSQLETPTCAMTGIRLKTPAWSALQRQAHSTTVDPSTLLWLLACSFSFSLRSQSYTPAHHTGHCVDRRCNNDVL